MIEKYIFGRMTVDGRDYTSDLVIFPDGTVQDGWRRTKGHRLIYADIETLIDAEPSVLVVGTGSVGIMKCAAGLATELEDLNIELAVARTAKAIEIYNETCSAKPTAACFHLAC